MSLNNNIGACITCGLRSELSKLTHIDKTLREIFNVLTISLDTGSSKTQIICDTCLKQVYQLFAFKSKCLETEDYLTPYVLQDVGNKLNLLQLIVDTNKENSKKIEKLLENVKMEIRVCRLCRNFVGGNVFVYLLKYLEKDNRKEIFEKCIPELNLEVTDNPIICGSCQKSFQNFYNFVVITLFKFKLIIQNNEICINETEKLYSCELCSYKSNDKALLRKHKIMHSDKTYECPKCLFVTNRKLSLKLHIQNIHEEINKNKDVFKCQNCSYKTFCQYYIKRHIKTCKTGKEHYNEKLYKCDFCKFLTKKKYLKNHMVKHDDKANKFQCLHCNFVTIYKRSIIAHLEIHKKIDETNVYKCPHCPYKGLRKVYLNTHIKRAHKKPEDIETYTCDSCFFKTANRKSLLQHIKFQHLGTDKRPTHKCTLCTYETKYVDHLKRHMMVHEQSKSKLFKCQECRYQTNFKENLKKHIIIHKTNKEVELHKCKQCNFKTKHKSYLKTHAQIHRNSSNNIKEYKCNLCEYKTLFSGNLTQHIIRRHHPEKLTKFMCTICDFVSTFKHNLINHVKIIHDTVKCEFKCTKCTYETKRKGCLRRHMRAMHSDSESKDGTQEL